MVCDNHFSVLMGALIKSIELNHAGSELIDIYIVEDRLKSSIKKKVIKTVNPQIVRLIWLEMSEVLSLAPDLPVDKSSFPLNVYIRLLIPYFLPKDIKKAIYLDVDMLMLADVSELWSIEIGGYALGGVQDCIDKIGNSWGGIKNYEELGLNPEDKYLNSGLLLMNLEQWRSHDYSFKIIRCIKENIQYANFPDQYGLNAIFAGRWLELDFRWNCYAILDEPQPKLIHFIRNKPIYTSYDNNIHYRELFYKYLDLTEWKSFKQYKNYRRLMNKFLNKIMKMF